MSSLADREVDAAAAASAFAQVYAETYGPLVAYCRRLTASAADAEELAQAALVQAWASWNRYAPGRPFWPWVTTIARNQAVDQRRRSARRVLSGDRIARLTADHRPLPDEIVEDEADRQLALDALRRLRPRYRRIVALRDIDGVSYEEIAESEGTSVEAVRGSLRRARVALRLTFSQMGGGMSAVFGLAVLRRLRDRVAAAAHRLEALTPASIATLSKAGEVVVAFVALAVVSSSGGMVVPRADDVVAPGATAPSLTAEPPSPRAPGTTTSAAPTSPRRAPMSGPGGAADVPALPVTPPGGLTFDGVREPEDADFIHVAASPRYAEDGVLYASGVARRGCPLGCHVLFKSTDRGETWQRLRGRGFAGGLIMLPPAFPEDSRVFVISEVALSVSRDDGESFENLTPLGGAAAMSPGFSSTDRRILVGAVPGWEYHDEVEKVTPLSFLPPPVGPVLTFAFAPDVGDARVFVGGTRSTASNRSESTIWLCAAGQCDEPIALEGSAGQPTIAVSPRFAGDGLAFAWRDERLYRTNDGGRSFSALAVPEGGVVSAVAYDAAGRVFIAIDSADGGGLFVSSDRGSMWTQLGRDTALGRGARAVTTLADGNVLASPSHNAGGGLLCSADGGHTWARRCPS